MQPSDPLVDLLHACYTALSDGDIDTLERLVTADAQAIGTDPDEWGERRRAVADLPRAARRARRVDPRRPRRASGLPGTGPPAGPPTARRS